MVLSKSAPTLAYFISYIWVTRWTALCSHLYLSLV